LGIAVPIFFSGNISKTKVNLSWGTKQNEEQKIEQFIRQRRMN
jgi:hypothetical protein